MKPIFNVLLTILALNGLSLIFYYSSTNQRNLSIQTSDCINEASLDQDSFRLGELTSKLEDQTPSSAEIDQILESVPQDQELDTDFSKDLETYQRTMNPFEILGAYRKIEHPYVRPDYVNTMLGILRDDEYCSKVDKYHLENPESILKKTNFFTNIPADQVGGRLMVKLGTVNKATLNEEASDDEIKRYNLPENVNHLFISSSSFYNFYEIGKHFLCATQMFNHIPGQYRFTAKDSILDLVDNYAEKFKDQPQCFNKSALFPQTYRLYNEQECQSFFNFINSNSYKESLGEQPIQYMLKIGHGSHKGDGVDLLDTQRTEQLQMEYNNGENCGKISAPLLAQNYIANPLLLDRNNKFDFRIYMLVTSTNPLIAFYHDGFLRVSLTPFNKSSNDKSTHMTNTHLSIKKLIEAKENNDTSSNQFNEKEVKNEIWWTLEMLETYLLETGRINDPNWLNNYLRPAFQKALVHLLRLSQDVFLKQSNVYELYGVDFMIDDQMNLWYIEANPNPQLSGYTAEWNKLYLSVMMGAFDIQSAYYKSRMTRVLNVVKAMQEEEKVKGHNSVDYGKWRMEYQSALKNRLEPKYKINSQNKWVPIINENLEGEKVYFGHIPSSCI